MRKHLKGLESAWAGIVAPEQKRKAVAMIRESEVRMGLPAEMPSGMSEIMAGSHSDGPREFVNGKAKDTMTVSPRSPDEPIRLLEPGIAINMVPTSWPDEAQVRILRPCPNPRLLVGQLEDGRVVSVWRGFKTRQIGERVGCRLTGTKGDPIYEVMP